MRSSEPVDPPVDPARPDQTRPGAAAARSCSRGGQEKAELGSSRWRARDGPPGTCRPSPPPVGASLPGVSFTDARPPRATEPAPRTARGLPPASTVALSFAAVSRRIRACAAPNRRPECARFICARDASRISCRPPKVVRAVSERVPLALRLGKAFTVVEGPSNTYVLTPLIHPLKVRNLQ